jgi:hypothetical protein
MHAQRVISRVGASNDDFLVMRKWGLESWWVGANKWVIKSRRFELLI